MLEWLCVGGMILCVPVIVGIAGYLMKHNPPKNINGIYGYRTSRSMKNQQTWHFANTYCGGMWLKWSIRMAAVGVVILVLIRNLSTETMTICGSIVMTVQCGLLLYSIIPVERELKRRFDKNGKRRVDDGTEN